MKVKIVFEELNKEIDLDREDILNMVQGTSPNYNAFNNPLVKKCGSYTGGFVEKWNWRIPDDVTTKELIDLYFICKNSWK